MIEKLRTCMYRDAKMVKDSFITPERIRVAIFGDMAFHKSSRIPVHKPMKRKKEANSPYNRDEL